MASVRAQGTTVIDNAARDEIADLANMLQRDGLRLLAPVRPS